MLAVGIFPADVGTPPHVVTASPVVRAGICFPVGISSRHSHGAGGWNGCCAIPSAQMNVWRPSAFARCRGCISHTRMLSNPKATNIGTLTFPANPTTTCSGQLQLAGPGVVSVELSPHPGARAPRPFLYSDGLRVDSSTGSGQKKPRRGIAILLAEHLAAMLYQDDRSLSPWKGKGCRFADDPHWRRVTLFHEYFPGDTGQAAAQAIRPVGQPWWSDFWNTSPGIAVFHLPTSLDKLEHVVPLTDEDRSALAGNTPVGAHGMDRARLAGRAGVLGAEGRVVSFKGDSDLITQRLVRREGHFFTGPCLSARLKVRRSRQRPWSSRRGFGRTSAGKEQRPMARSS